MFSPRSARIARQALEEKWDWHLQDGRHLLQATCADTILSVLVFLHLLECHANGVCQVCLAHAEHHPTHAHAVADVCISRVWQFFHLSSYPLNNRRAQSRNRTGSSSPICAHSMIFLATLSVNGSRRSINWRAAKASSKAAVITSISSGLNASRSSNRTIGIGPSPAADNRQ